MASPIHFETLLQKCNSLIQVKQFQAHLITTGRFQFHHSRTKLIELCALSPAAGYLSFAVEIFRQLHAPKTNDWNAILRGLAQSENPTNAITWFRTIVRSPQKIDALTCSFALKACARALALSKGTQIHSQILRSGFDADVLLVTTFLDVYAKSGDLDAAKKVFDEMSRRDIASWNVLISGLAQGN